MPSTVRSPEIAGYRSAAGIFAKSAELLRWPERVSVSEAAERHRRLENPGGGYSEPWQNWRAPWTVRPMDCLGSGDYRLVVFKGPAQAAKSEIQNNWLLHSVIYDPANLLWLQADKDLMRAYVKTRIDDMIRLCPEMRERLRQNDPSADTAKMKLFAGCETMFLWPVKKQLQSHPAPRFVIDDFDRVPEDIEGEGSAIGLLQARQTTFEGYEVGYVGSSPSLGANRGIEAEVAKGTNERWNWPCLECGDFFAPDFERDLRFERAGTPEDARSSAHVVCPNNGCIIEPKSKEEMNAAGTWIGPEQSVTPSGKVKGDLRRSSTASFSFDGLAGFTSWGRLSELWREADLDFAIRQDEKSLRTFFNTRGGKNYKSKVEGQEPIDAEALAGRRETFRLGEVDPAVECLTAAVDNQHDRFEVEVKVKGWAADFESWIVDRFSIRQLADGRTNIDPSGRPEHWAVLLERVILARYVIAGTEVELPIMTTAIDTGGLENVSANAVRFFHLARNAGVGSKQITLIKGGNNPNAKLLPAPTYLEVDARGRPKKTGARLWVPNVNQAKDILNVRLRRETPGPGFIHFPKDLDEAHLDELTAEEKEGAFWKKVSARNETLDLEVYNYVAFLRLVGEACDLRRVPKWARRPRDLEIPPPANAKASDPKPEQPAEPDPLPNSTVRRRRRRR